MLPEFLRIALHQQQAAVFQNLLRFFPRDFMAENKLPLRTERQRRNARAVQHFLLIIAVPAHSLRAILVKIQQAGIEFRAGSFFGSGFQFPQFFWEDFRPPCFPGIAVFHFPIGKPRHFPFGKNRLAEHQHLIVLPRDFHQQIIHPKHAFLRGKHLPEIHRIAIFWKKVFQG